MIYPVKLSGHTMTPAGQIHPVSMSLNWKINGLSTSTMVLDVNAEPQLALGNWVLITAPMGNQSGVFYVKNLKTNYINGQVTVTLEHTFGLLQEMVVFGEVTPETIGGSGSTSVTSTAAINYLLARQTSSYWTLYQNDFSSVSQGWKFTHSDIYNGLGTIAESIADCQWEFDQSSLPWKLSLKAFPTATTMEMRKNRNIESMTVTVDKSQMYTRVYPTGRNNLHIDSVNSGVSYLERNTGTWGVISKVITDSSIDNASLLKAWATAMLKKNSEPSISVNIGGLELSEVTGESLDALKIGRLCRIPLPDYDTTVTERIVELAWRDCILSEKQVTVTLANELRTIQSVLYEIAKSGSGGGKKANLSKDCDLKEVEEGIETFENADIWINRASVWAVCGAYDVYTDGDGVKHLVVKEGGALTIERNNIEYGLYDKGNLNAGVMVSMLSDGTTTTKIKSDYIDFQGFLQGYTGWISSLSVNSFHSEGDIESLENVKGYSLESTGGDIILGYDTASLHTITIDGTVQTAKFLGTDDLSFSIANTQIYRSGVLAAGTLSESWSKVNTDDTYAPIYTVESGTHQTESITVSTASSGWSGISANHPGSCIVYADAGGEHRAVYTVLGNLPYQQGFADGSSTSGIHVEQQSEWTSIYTKTIYVKDADDNTITTDVVSAADLMAGVTQSHAYVEYSNYTQFVVTNSASDYTTRLNIYADVGFSYSGNTDYDLTITGEAEAANRIMASKTQTINIKPIAERGNYQYSQPNPQASTLIWNSNGTSLITRNGFYSFKIYLNGLSGCYRWFAFYVNV